MEVIRASQRLDTVIPEGRCCLRCLENTDLPNERFWELNTGVPKSVRGTRRITGGGWKLNIVVEVRCVQETATSLFNKELPKEPNTY